MRNPTVGKGVCPQTQTLNNYKMYNPTVGKCVCPQTHTLNNYKLYNYKL